MNRRVLAMMFIMLFSLFVIGCGSANDKSINTNVNKISELEKSEKQVNLPVMDINKPIIVMYKGDQKVLNALPEKTKDEVFISAQDVCQMLEAQFGWDEKSKQLTINKAGSEIKLKIGKAQAEVKGKSTTLDTAPYLKENQHMVPVLFICKAFGVPVEFNSIDGILYIDSPHSKGFKLERFKRYDNESYYKLIDLKNTPITAKVSIPDGPGCSKTVPRDITLIGLEEKGMFLVFQDKSTNTGKEDHFPIIELKIIWEDGFAKDYSNKMGSYNLDPADSYSIGSAPSIWSDNKYNYYSLSSTIYMGANMNRIAKIGGKNDNSLQESHGNVVRVDCNGKTITGFDTKKRLYFTNEIPVLADGNTIPINQSFQLGNCNFAIKSMDIKTLTYYKSAGWLEEITKPNCGILKIIVTPNADTYNHYTYEVSDVYHQFGKKIAADYDLSNQKTVFYVGVKKEFTVQSTVVPIIDCGKLSILITDDETKQFKELMIPLVK